jgi:hypothetical protein
MALLAPAVPSWVMAEKEAAMQVHWQILKTTAFVGVPTERGFQAEGTCFFLAVQEEDLDFFYIVTCRHVARPTRDGKRNKHKLWVRMNRKSGPPRIEETIRDNWICHQHSAIDVCIYPFPVLQWDHDDDLDVSTLRGPSTILTEDRYREFGLSLGDEVFIVGAFIGQVGERKNIPVVRVANIASMPDEPLWAGSPSGPAFLIETRSMGGISGSPVFLEPQARGLRMLGNWGLPIDQQGNVVSPYLVFAMMQGMHSGQYANDFVADDDIEKIVPKDADFNAGIGIAIPISQVMEVINREDMRKARRATIEAKRKDSGYKPTCAVASKLLDHEGAGENPSHREDFTALLSAAVRKQKLKR